MAASSTYLYCRLRSLSPNIDAVLRFAIHAVSVQRAQDSNDRKGTQERCWAVVWTETTIKCVDVAIAAA
jgi:hypothetical protein